MSSSTLRLIFPIWQGPTPEIVDYYVPELPSPLNIIGYELGSKILQMITPKASGPEITVPVSMATDKDSLKVENGISAKKPIIQAMKDATKIIKEQNPDRIITLGGDCSASVPPFMYLSQKYGEDLAIIWIDAHPDIDLPEDPYDGFSAMALGHILGHGDKDILSVLPHPYTGNNVTYIGLRAVDETQKKRVKEYGINVITCEQFRENPQTIVDWIKSTKCSKVLVHLDLDVTDSDEIILAVGKEPNGMKLNEVAEAVNLIDSSSDIVAFTVAEHMPRTEMILRHFLSQLKVFNK